jgi:hypothetical protein
MIGLEFKNMAMTEMSIFKIIIVFRKIVGHREVAIMSSMETG